MIASFPMYDLAEIRSSTDALWKAIAAAAHRAGEAAGEAVPSDLTRPTGRLLEHWLRPDILLSQSCGYPVARSFTPHQHVLGSFDVSSAEPGAPGWYRSVIVCRSNDDRRGRDLRDFDGCIAAVNDPDSLSGWVSLGWALAEHDAAARSVVYSASHAESLQVVRNGMADIASIDAHTLALLNAHRPTAVEGIHIVSRGPLVALTPLFTAIGGLVDVLREAIGNAIEDLSAWDRATLQISGWVPHGDEAHRDVLALAQRARLALPIPKE